GRPVRARQSESQHPDHRRRPDQRALGGRRDDLLPRPVPPAGGFDFQEPGPGHAARRDRPRRRAHRPRIQQNPHQARQPLRESRVQRGLQEDPGRQGTGRRAAVRRRHRRQGVLLLIAPISSLPPDEPAGLKAPEPEFELNLSEYVAMVRRHWKLLAVTCLLSLVAAGIHYAITPKQFQASSTIQIERRNMSPVGSGQNPWLENYWNMEFYPTQYELLQSRGLAERVVKSMDLMSDPALNPAAGPARDGKKGATAEDDQATLGRLADQLRGALTVDPVRNTQLVRISFQAATPEFAARAANGFAQAFIDMGVEDRFASAGKASIFLGTQIESLEQEITEKESQLQAFSRRSDIITLDPGANVVLKRLESLNTSLMEAKKTRIEKEAHYHEVMVSPPETVADSLSGGVVSGLRSEQIRLERDYEAKLKTFKPDWPEMVALKTQIDKGKQHLEGLVKEMLDKARNSANADYQSALRQEQSLESELTQSKKLAIDQSS